MLTINATVFVLQITGNELIHQLTSHGTNYEVRVDLTDFDGDSIFAKYSQFSVGPGSENYTLNVTGYDDQSTACEYHVILSFQTKYLTQRHLFIKNIDSLSKKPWVFQK